MKQHKLNKAMLNVARLNVANLNYVGERTKGSSPVVDDGYFHFKDPEVERIVVANWGDGVGITQEQVEAITSIGTVFRGNSVIETFDEFEKFISVTNLSNDAFMNCTNLRNAKLPNTITSLPDGNANVGTFRNCSSLRSLTAKGITSIGRASFINCSLLLIIGMDIPKVTAIGYEAFQGCASIEYMNLNSVVTIGGICFRNCTSIKYIDLGEHVSSIGQYQFGDSSASPTTLEYIICRAVTPPTLGSNAWYNSNSCPIYVPDTSVEAYKTASNWSTYADRIFPLSNIDGSGTDNITFADAAVEAICLTNYDNNGDGVISKVEAASVTTTAGLFRDNTTITTFDEF